MTANSTIGVPASTAPTSCQASKQRPLFLPLQRTPPTSFGPWQLAFLALPRKQSTKIKSIAISLHQGEGCEEEEQGRDVAPHQSTPRAQRSVDQQRFPSRRNSPSYLRIINSDTHTRQRTPNPNVRTPPRRRRFCPWPCHQPLHGGYHLEQSIFPQQLLPLHHF